jgi:hypothetical protein
MPRCLIPLLFACALCGADAAASSGRVVDRPVRFVNNRIVTISDILVRNGVRIEQWRQSATGVLPDNRLQFSRETLELLTDEELLVQKAEELQVAIDRDQLSSEVIAEARMRGLALRDIAELRRFRDREAKRDAVLGWFESRAATISPSELQHAYESRKAEFVRPPRARTLMIALRPTGDNERRELVKATAGLMSAAQTDKDPALAAAATSRLDALLAADLAGQETILAEVATAIAAQAEREGLGKESAGLVTQATELAVRWRGVRSRATCQTLLEQLRAEVLQLPAEQRAAAFAQRAQAISQGPHAADGGMLGWVEPKTYGAEIEEQALAMPLHEPSTPFSSGDALAIVLVTEREEGRTQSFNEVSAALQAALDRERRIEVRRRVIAVLRSQSSIRDVVDLDTLLR